MLSPFVLLNTAFAQEEITPPAFSKVFIPDAIGPGSTTELLFTIDNANNPSPVAALAFTDTLPAELNLASPALVANSCMGTVSASDGGDTISLANGEIGALQTCQIIVNVTGSTPGEGPYTNTSGDLTSTAGNSGNAIADLSIDDNIPGFTKSFAPSMVEIGGRSTLIITIDNTTECGSCAPDIYSLSFADNLPSGMVIATPAYASTDCGNPLLPPTLTANSGTSVVSLFASGGFNAPALESEASCTVNVDVVGSAVGSLGNVTSELTVGTLSASVSAGKAAAVLEVTGYDNLITLSKEFTNDPVASGGSVNLKFTVTNRSRTDSANAITFTDDLEATLTGLAPALPFAPMVCGGGSSLNFSGGVLTLVDGSLPPEGVCTFSVELMVPSGTSGGTYTNTAGPVSGDIGGSPETGNVASDLLFIVTYPVLSMNYASDTVAAGDSVTVEFTITNTNTSSTMSSIEFIDELTDGSGDSPPDTTSGFLPFPVNVTLPPVPDPPCGAGSSLSLIYVDNDRQGLQLTGGDLAAAGVAGDSCTFSVSMDIPVGLSGGIYMNTTENITAVLDGVGGAPTVSGPPASDTLVVASAPRLTKSFSDGPITPDGGLVTLEFNLTYTAGSTADATAIAFTDDLSALSPAIPGLVATSVDSNDCANSIVDISTPAVINFSDGTLTPGESCTVSLTLNVPALSPVGTHTNTTSDITAIVDAVAVSGSPGEDDLVITSLLFSKEFLSDSVIPGDTVGLRFTIENIDPTNDATITYFTDNLNATLAGLAAIGPPLVNTCGGTLSGTTSLTYISGSVLSGTDCVIEVELLVPVTAAPGVYTNVTSDLLTSFGVTEPASDKLTVESILLALTKKFVDSPAVPGDSVTLKFNLTNLSGTETVNNIAFGDDLASTLAGLVATSEVENTCTGSTVDISNPTLIDFIGGSLTPGQSCDFTLLLAVPAAPLPGNIFANTTSVVTGKVGGLDVFGDPASDELLLKLVNFSKSFYSQSSATGTVELSFTIENLDSVNSLGGLSFSDNLDDVISGLVATDLPAAPCGAGSTMAGTSFISMKNGSIPASGNCTFSVTVAVPATAEVGTFVNTTSVLFDSGQAVSDPATANLIIVINPVFSDGFE